MIECPVCKGKTHVEIDTHSDGYAENLQECGDCGAVWVRKGTKNLMVHGSTCQQAVNL
jgi:Zn-finger nucleic acid-binding protein